MRKLSRIAAMLVLVLYGLTSMHCMLEGVPGLDFLKICCFVESAPTAPEDCDSEACAVESGDYRAEERTVSAPQPLLILALVPEVMDPPRLEPQAGSFMTSEAPPELPKVWQFSHRTALPPRAPSLAS